MQSVYRENYDSENWDSNCLLVFKLGLVGTYTSWNLHKLELAQVGTCTSWNLHKLELAQVGTCTSWNLHKLELAQVGTCPNWNLPKLELAQVGTCPSWNLPKLELAQVGTCPSWNLPKLELAQVGTCPSWNLIFWPSCTILITQHFVLRGMFLNRCFSFSAQKSFLYRSLKELLSGTIQISALGIDFCDEVQNFFSTSTAESF